MVIGEKLKTLRTQNNMLQGDVEKLTASSGVTYRA